MSAKVKSCPHCCHPNPANATYCSTCGQTTSWFGQVAIAIVSIFAMMIGFMAFMGMIVSGTASVWR